MNFAHNRCGNMPANSTGLALIIKPGMSLDFCSPAHLDEGFLVTLDPRSGVAA